MGNLNPHFPKRDDCVKKVEDPSLVYTGVYNLALSYQITFQAIWMHYAAGFVNVDVLSGFYCTDSRK